MCRNVLLFYKILIESKFVFKKTFDLLEMAYNLNTFLLNIENFQIRRATILYQKI